MDPKLLEMFCGAILLLNKCLQSFDLLLMVPRLRSRRATELALALLLVPPMLLAHLGRPDLDHTIGEAVKVCLANGHVTPELGGALSTSEATQAVLDALQL